MLELSQFKVTEPPVDPTALVRDAAWPNATKELTCVVLVLIEVRLGPKTTAHVWQDRELNPIDTAQAWVDFEHVPTETEHACVAQDSPPMLSEFVQARVL